VPSTGSPSAPLTETRFDSADRFALRGACAALMAQIADHRPGSPGTSGQRTGAAGRSPNTVTGKGANPTTLPRTRFARGISARSVAQAHLRSTRAPRRASQRQRRRPRDAAALPGCAPSGARRLDGQIEVASSRGGAPAGDSAASDSSTSCRRRRPAAVR
jgi:hypothetical protein